MYTLIVFGAGLIVGWNFLPQPSFVKGLVDRATSWVRDRLKR